MQTLSERREYQKRYQQDNTEVWHIRLSKIYDSDIIDAISDMKEKSGLSKSEIVKTLIRGQQTIY